MSVTGINPQKYGVTRLNARKGESAVLDEGTFFVLKQGDVLAVAALRSYANNALMLLESHRMMVKNGTGGFLSAHEQAHLEHLAHDAMFYADEWESRNNSKLPD